MFLGIKTTASEANHSRPQREPRFKLEFNEKETITGRAGLGIYGELYKSRGVYEVE